MIKLAARSYDVLDFLVNGEIDELSEMASGLSKQAQSAVIPDVDEINDRDESDFALILHDSNQGEMRKFAKFNKELVEININILSKQANQLPDEILKVAAHNLGRAALDMGVDIPDNLIDYAGESFINNHVDLSDVEKTASYRDFSPLDESPDGPYALPTIGKYPIRNETELLKAAEYFDIHHRIFDMDEKLEYANNVYKQAQDQNVDLSDRFISKYARLDENTLNPDLEDHIRIRQGYLPDNSFNYSIYDELLEKSAELSPSDTMYALSEVDKRTGVWTSWGKGVADPAISVLGINKSAGVEIDGEYVSVEDIKRIPSDYLTEKVGTALVDDLKGPDGPDILKSLPRPIRREILDEWIG